MTSLEIIGSSLIIINLACLFDRTVLAPSRQKDIEKTREVMLNFFIGYIFEIAQSQSKSCMCDTCVTVREIITKKTKSGAYK